MGLLHKLALVQEDPHRYWLLPSRSYKPGRVICSFRWSLIHLRGIVEAESFGVKQF